MTTEAPLFIRPGCVLVRFDTSALPFRSFFERAFGDPNLEMLHDRWKVKACDYATRVATSQMAAPTSDSLFQRVIDDMIRRVIEPLCGPIGVRQREATARFHFAIGDEWARLQTEAFERFGPEAMLARYYFQNAKRPPFHRDGAYPGRVVSQLALNLWIPMTKAFDTNSIWVGGLSDGGQSAKPVMLEYGDILIFYGVALWHGVVWNTTAVTRVSFDLRVIPDIDNEFVRRLRLAE